MVVHQQSDFQFSQIHNNSKAMLTSKQKSKQISSIRSNYRQEIRRKHLEALFSERRKMQNARSSSSQAQTQQQADQSFLSMMLKQSLIKNHLLEQIRKNELLSLFEKMIMGNASYSHEYVLSICANILLDEISIEEKEKVFQICCCGILVPNFARKEQNVRETRLIMPMAQIYFYRNLIHSGYEYLQQSQQIWIEQNILPRALSILHKCKNAENFNDLQQEALTIFFHFFKPDEDHNNTLLYKAKRNSKILQQLIEYSAEADLGNQNLLLSLSIFYNVLEIPLPLCLVIGVDSCRRLAQCLFSKVECNGQLDSKESERIEAISAKALACLLEESEDWGADGIEEILSSKSQQQIFPAVFLSIEFHNSGFNYLQPTLLVPKLNLLHSLIRKLAYVPQDYLKQSVSKVLQLISREQENTDSEILLATLQIICSVLEIGYEQGDSSYCQFIKSTGGLKVIEVIDVKRKGEKVNEVIHKIWDYIDIC